MIKVLLILLSFAHSYVLSLSVQPGDTVEMEVFAKYIDHKRNSDGREIASGILSALTAGAPIGTGVDGIPNSIGTQPTEGANTLPFGAVLDKSDDAQGPSPRAYLNWLVFNPNFAVINGGYVRVSEAAKEDGTGTPHEQLYKKMPINAPGYVYVWLSNEDNTEVYFDDFTINITQGPVIQVNEYYPYGLPAYTYVRTGEKETKEKFQGKEYNDKTGLYDFQARQYDAALGRWFAVDPAGQFVNPYLAMGNNPMMMVDPDGEWIAQVIGAIAGGYSGWKLAEANGAHGWKKLGYVLGGAAIGALSGGLGAEIAASGGVFANTVAIVTASSVNSMGMNLLSGGKTDNIVSFGAASYNLDQGEWGYLGKKGNSKLENIGYGLGALANLNDANNLINATKATLYTQERYPDGSKDIISHSGIVDDASGEKLMSFGPSDNKIGGGGLKDQIGGIKPGGSYKKFALAIRKGTSEYPVPTALSKEANVTVNKHLFAGLREFSRVVPYQGMTTNCVNMSSLGLWLNGIPNIGIHPYLLHYSIAAYNSGLRPDLFSYYLQQQ